MAQEHVNGLDRSTQLVQLTTGLGDQDRAGPMLAEATQGHLQRGASKQLGRQGQTQPEAAAGLLLVDKAPFRQSKGFGGLREPGDSNLLPQLLIYLRGIHGCGITSHGEVADICKPPEELNS